MRLLERVAKNDYRLTNKLPDNEIPPYAILSHTWGPDHEEITYEDLIPHLSTARSGDKRTIADMEEDSYKAKHGYRKLQFCGEQAFRDGLRYFWIDSCCIKKSDSAELSESLISMFRWYQDSVRCYTYLSDVSVAKEHQLLPGHFETAFQQSRWFSRGWTLQELLAPQIVEFYSEEGVRLGNKKSFERKIHDITGIPVAALRGHPLAEFSVDERLLWAKHRQTTRVEDRAYCLFGIFQIFLPPLYGERENAFKRLTAEIAKSTENFRQSQDCLKSLAFPQMHYRLVGIKPHFDGTCEWLFRHETFRTWAMRSRELLWIKGKPGSGKSTIMKHILSNVPRVPGAKNGDLILSFFFHARGDTLQKSPLGFFRSILHQLLKKVPHSLSDLIDAFGQRTQELGEPEKKWNWHQEELRKHLEVALPKVLQAHSIWLFVDALDECGEDDAVRLAGDLKSLCRLLPPGGFQFHICFTCRQYPILAPFCEFEICLQEENGRDISTYVHDRLSAFHSRTPSAIPTLVESRACGLFLWAQLVVDRVLALDRQGFNEAKIRASILTIPPGLQELFSELIREMRPDSLKLIRWTCFAARPLSVDELRWAMVLDSEYPYQSLEACEASEDYIPDNDRMEKQLLTLSCGLAEVTLMAGVPTVQFIHQSVKDFFTETGLSALAETSISAEIARGLAHARLSMLCLRYLAMPEISAELGSRLGLSNPDLLLPSSDRVVFPFLLYAAGSWTIHAKHGDCISTMQAPTYLTELPQSVIDIWGRVYERIEPFSGPFPGQGTTLIHIAAQHGLIQTLENFLAMAPTAQFDINAKDGWGRTPLWLAARHGQELVVKLQLTTAQVDVNAQDNEGKTALFVAAEHGHEPVVQLLLASRQADFNMQDIYGRTPLFGAAEYGYETVVKLFLEIDETDLNIQDCEGETPLWVAAATGHKPVVQLLLESGQADVNLQDNDGKTPLFAAARNGDESVVKLLLESGQADVNLQNNDGLTPLFVAAGNGIESVVRLLLERGQADVNLQNNDGKTPLFAAVGNLDESVVQLLLKSGQADVNLQDNDGKTPLFAATRYKNESVVRLLLESGQADVNIQDKSGRTPLFLAARHGDDAILTHLLATRKASINLKDKDGLTPFWTAVTHGHEAVAELLLATGQVDISIRCICMGISSLRLRPFSSETPSAFLEMPGQVGSCVDLRYYHWAPLNHAAAKGREAVIKRLLAMDQIDINVTDEDDQTPLWQAAANGHEAAVKLLVATGRANINARAKCGRTPLSEAAACGYTKVVELLLATGVAEVNARDIWGQTPLSVAVAAGRTAIVELLLSTGRAVM